MVKILGIESTCDETACAVVEDGTYILSNVVASSSSFHSQWGGVVPELACRHHIDALIPSLSQALDEAGCTLDEIDSVAVANTPGLIGALLIGINAAKSLGFFKNIPVIGVNHIEAHLYAATMGASPKMPALGLVISGGHTALVKMDSAHGPYQLIGQTQDDAIGEAFDKIASLLGLAYPGGPNLEKLALGGNPLAYAFKAGHVKNNPYAFSFSGLKTNVLYAIKGQNGNKHSPDQLSDKQRQDIAASFQKTAFDDIITKAIKAATDFQCQSLILGGGVCQNKVLRTTLTHSSPLPVYFPLPQLTLDNAAMIAGLGYHLRHLSHQPIEALPRSAFFSKNKC